jgi:allophanate hydrolase
LGPQPRARPAEGFHSAADLMPRYDSAIVHITPTSQKDLFEESAWRSLTESDYRVSTASDRTGYKLEGPALRNSLGALPSEASCPGAIQIPGDGRPIALMADAPTIGGYPKIRSLHSAARAKRSGSSSSRPSRVSARSGAARRTCTQSASSQAVRRSREPLARKSVLRWRNGAAKKLARRARLLQVKSQ